jgi:type VI secretion system secreted protein VgrG
VAGSIDQAATGQSVSSGGQSSSSGGGGKSSAPPAKPFVPSNNSDPSTPPKTGWVEVQMVDESSAAVAGLEYSIALPDGSVAEGTLDENGLVRVEGFDPGNCQVSFPGLDQGAWEAQ